MRFSILATVLLFHSALLAQVIKVEIKQEKDAPVENAVIGLRPQGTSETYSAFSNKAGQAQLKIKNFQGEEKYVLTITSIGHFPYKDTLEGKSLLSGLDVKLKSRVFNLDETVVTAQYGRNSSEKSVHTVRVITQKEIENMAAVNLEDVLTYSANIRIAQDNILGSSLQMQGIAGQNVKIMIDGVPIIGRMNGNIDLSQINMNNVERIEVIEGPLSVNYGTNALAGTINIITKSGKARKSSLAANLYFENIGHHNVNIDGATNLLGTTLRFSAGRNYFDGWKPGEDFWPSYEPQLADSNRNLQWNPKEQYFGRLSAEKEIMGWNFLLKYEQFTEDIINRGTPRAPYMEMAFDDVYQTDRADKALIITKEFDHHSLRLTTAHNGFTRTKNTFLKDLTTLDENLGAPSAQDTSRFQQFMSRGTISSTTESRFNYQIGYDLNRELAFGDRIENQEAALGDYSLFASAEYYLLDDLVLKPGLRATYNTAYNAPLTPSLNVKFSKAKSTFRASYARGFRAPSLKELYFLFVDVNHNIKGNDDLLAEHSHNFMANWQRNTFVGSSLVKTSLGLFHNFIDNRITLAQINDVEFSYINVGSFTTQGARAEVQYIGRKLKTGIILNRLGIESSLSEAPSKFNYYSEVVGNLQWMLPEVGLSISGFYKYQGRLTNFSLNAEGEIKEQFVAPYQIFDVNCGKSFLGDKVKLSFGVKNIFDVQNVQAGIASTAHSSGGNNVAIGTGRSFFSQLIIRI